MRIRGWCTVLLATLILVATGCDDGDLLAGRATGNLDVRVEDDPLRGALLSIGGGIDTVFASPRLRYSGVLEGGARLEISENRRRFHDLGSKRIEVPISVPPETATPTSGAPQFDRIAAPSGRYRVVRLTLRDAKVRLAAGSVLRDTILNGSAVLEVTSVDRDREAAIERVIESFRLAAGSDVSLTFDLNTHVWITRANVRAGRVSEEALRTATTLRISGRETIR